MLDYQVALLSLVSILVASLGAIVFLRNVGAQMNLYYLLFTLTASIWIFTNAIFRLGFRPYPVALISYASAGLTALFILVFNFEFAKQKFLLSKKTIITIGVSVSLFSLVPGAIATGVTASGEIITNQNLYIFGLYLFTYFGAGLAVLVQGFKKASGSERRRTGIMLFGLLQAIFFGLFFNLILPIFGVYRFVYLGPLFAFVYAACIGYAIVKHQLFDIRLIIARSLAYGLLILTLGLTYGFLVFSFIDQFSPSTQTTNLQQIIYTLLAVFLAFTFQPLKRFFDRLTDRLFYRDRYDSGAVLNTLGKVYVSRVNSFELLDDSLEVLVNALRVEFGHLLVLDKGKIYRQAHYGGHKNLKLEARAFRDFDSQVSIYDELGENDMRRHELRETEAQAVIRLATQDGLIGYLVLGTKQSGVIYTQQDVNLLGIVSQELAVAIQNAKSYAQIQAFSETLKAEVREATTQLRETNQRLRKLDAAKDEFISMASHQLRTPLTSIKGYVSMLQDGDAGALAEGQRQYLGLAFASVEKMNNLITDMLNVSRISTGKLTFDKAPVDLNKLVESEINQLRGLAEVRQVQIDFQPLRESLPLLNLDTSKIRQVVMNFIDNAIYYTPKGQVTVSLEQVDGNAEFKVKDNGIGVSREAQKQLFNKFFRADNAQKVRPDGTGLGLYMAKQVVEAQDGQIIFSSVEGKGSTFGFRFRLQDN